MRVALTVGAACAAALAVQALLAARGSPRHPALADPMLPDPALADPALADPALPDPAPAAGPTGVTAERRGWEAAWRITLSVVLARMAVLVLLGLTPFGAILLVPISEAGEALATPLVVLVLGGLAWLPGRLARPARARVHAELPVLRPFRAEGGSPAAAWLRPVLLAGIVLLLVVSQRAEDPAVSLAATAGYLAALVVLVRLTRRLGLNRPVPLDDALPPGQGVARLVAAQASLRADPHSPFPVPARLLVGRFRGRGVNAWATRLDREWAVVVAPELLARLDDAELRALLAHESGHLSAAGARRRQLAVVLAGMAAALIGLDLPYAVWDGYVGWLVTGLDDLPVAYGTALLTAIQLAVGYLAFVLLRPLVLVVHRADEAAADRGMLRMTADPQACVRFLARQSEIFGLPYRWTLAQRLLVATHPALGDRVAALAGQAVRGRS